MENRAEISTLLPSWVEQAEASSHAFALTFGLYGRPDTAECDLLPSRTLAYESARAQLRAAELAHMEGRRLLRSDEKCEWYVKSYHKACEEVAKLKGEKASLEDLNSTLRERMEPEATKQLLSRISELESEVASLRTRNARLAPRTPLPPPAENAISEQELRLALHKNAAATVRHVFQTLQEAELLKPNATQLTPEELMPEIFRDLPESDSESSGYSASE